MILTLGAGSVSQFGPMILEKLKERERRWPNELTLELQ